MDPPFLNGLPINLSLAGTTLSSLALSYSKYSLAIFESWPFSLFSQQSGRSRYWFGHNPSMKQEYHRPDNSFDFPLPGPFVFPPTSLESAKFSCWAKYLRM